MYSTQLEILNRLHIEEMLRRAQRDHLAKKFVPSLSDQISHFFRALAPGQQTLRPKPREVIRWTVWTLLLLALVACSSPGPAGQTGWDNGNWDQAIWQ